MKNCQCGYKTKNDEYKICPMCGEQLELFTGKRLFTMGLSAEESFTGIKLPVIPVNTITMK